MSIGIAVVGAGHWGPHLIRNFHENPSSSLEWIVELDERRLEALGERFPNARLTSAFEDVLDDPRVDGVVVATPTTTHFELVSKALISGHHVLVEKPISDSVDSAARLVDLARAHERVLLVGHVFLFNSSIRATKELIDSGELGAIRYLSMARTNLGPVRFDVNAAWDLASHDISIANYWLDQTPSHASATGGSWLNPGVADAVFATLRYPNDVMVHIEASWLNPRKNRTISVIGSDKMATIDDVDLNEPIRIYDKGVVEASAYVTDTFSGFRAQVREGTVTIPKVPGGEPLRTECDAFLARIDGDTSLLSGGQDGLEVVRVLEAIDHSLKQGGAEIQVGTIR